MGYHTGIQELRDLVNLKDYLNKPADPFNDYEPVDSSAAAIAAQGLLRLGNNLTRKMVICTPIIFTGRQDSKYWTPCWMNLI